MAVTVDLEEIVLNSAEVQSAINHLTSTAHGREKQRLSASAQKYFSGMRGSINAQALGFGQEFAGMVVKFSFTDVQTSGLEDAAHLLKRGGSAIFSTHFSYFDVAVLPHIFGINDSAGVYYVAGENVAHVPVIGKYVEKLLRNSGAIFVKRNIAAEGRDGLLFHAVLQAYSSCLLSQGKNVLNFAGHGRHRTGEVELVASTASPAIIRKAMGIIPVAVTYDVVPEDRMFASSTSRRRGGRSILEAIKLIRWDKFYGTAYVNFGKSLEAAAYCNEAEDGKPLGKQALIRFHNDVTKSLIRLVTLTPVNALAVILSSKNAAYPTMGDLAESAHDLVSRAVGAGMHVSQKLSDGGVEEAMRFAAEKLAKRGAVKYARGTFSIQQPKLITHYSNTVRPTLNAFGVLAKN